MKALSNKPPTEEERLAYNDGLTKGRTVTLEVAECNFIINRLQAIGRARTPTEDNFLTKTIKAKRKNKAVRLEGWEIAQVRRFIERDKNRTAVARMLADKLSR